MERTSAIRQLPALHAVAMRLKDDGVSERVIAVAIEVGDNEVPLFLEIAEAKLARLMADSGERG